MFIDEPNVKATILFLQLTKVKVNNATVNETLQNHPDYPSLLCVSDALNKWSIPNGAGKIEPEKINTLPTPFIAYTSDRNIHATPTLFTNGYQLPDAYSIEDLKYFLLE